MAPQIVPVVEGQGDLAAVPLLIRRLLEERLTRYDVQVSKPKVANGKATLVRDLEKFLRYAAITPNCMAILVLLDADRDCPKRLALNLADRARNLRLKVPVAVICAKHEYETWVIASLTGHTGDPLRRHLELDLDVVYEGNAETLRGPKEWITRHMPSGRAYKETSDQVTVTSFLDLNLVHSRSRSFERLCHGVEQLVESIDGTSRIVTP